MSSPAEKAITERPLARFDGEGLATELTDQIAVEEPLEIRVNGEPVAVTMRTPGDDHRLAIGFLFSEGIIRGLEDLGTVAHCGRPDDEGYGNVLDVRAAPGADLDVEKVQASRRGTLTTSACGVCGRRSVDDLYGFCGAVPEGPVIGHHVVARAADRLREIQRVFARTGGTHAAAVLDARGRLLAGHEDIGRHNAVDKVVGALVQRGLTASRGAHPGRHPEGEPPAMLVVSGRASFEMVQKAAVARIPIVVSVSAASSLAIDLAERMNITLATFARAGRFNLCTHPRRVGAKT